MFRIFLILAGFAASAVMSLSLIPLQFLTTSENHSTTEVAFNTSNATSRSILSSTSSRIPSISALNNSDQLPTYSLFECDTTRFGHPNLTSCRGALKQMPNSWEDSTYGDRTVFGKDVDFPMPVRYASSKEVYIFRRR